MNDSRPREADHVLADAIEAPDIGHIDASGPSDLVGAIGTDGAVDTTDEITGNNEVLSAVSGVSALPILAFASTAYKSFPINVLPEVVRNFVFAAAAAIGCDPAFIALPLLGSLARAIGNRRLICLKPGSWTEPAIIWAAIVGKSGTHKTPAIQAGTGFLQQRETKAIEEYQKALAEYIDGNRAETSSSRSTNGGPTRSTPELNGKPSCVRYITSDITIEALAAILAAQLDGLLVVRDELAGWLNGIAEYKRGNGSDLGHWLASWSATPMTVDRKTGPQRLLRAPRAAVSIIGGIQPDVLKRSIGREHMQDGLCARLLLAMPDPRPVQWSEDTVSSAIEAAMSRVIEGLLALEPAVDENGDPTPQEMPLSGAAKAAWVSYFNRHRCELAGLDNDFAAAWSKLEAYTARFALIFQLCSLVAGEPYTSPDVIDEVAMLNAITLSDWFGGEARRVYGRFAESEADRQVRELCELIRGKGGSISVRDLMRSSRRYSTAEAAEGALARLAQRGGGRWKPVPPGSTGGQPTRVFHLVDTVDADTTFENSRNNEVVSASAAPEVRDEPLEEFGETNATENPDPNVPVLTGESEWGEV
jgi:hypothetical protein